MSFLLSPLLCIKVFFPVTEHVVLPCLVLSLLDSSSTTDWSVDWKTLVSFLFFFEASAHVAIAISTDVGSNFKLVQTPSYFYSFWWVLTCASKLLTPTAKFQICLETLHEMDPGAVLTCFLCYTLTFLLAGKVFCWGEQNWSNKRLAMSLGCPLVKLPLRVPLHDAQSG